MNFIHLIERAISTQPEDHSVLKEFFNREYKKAERDHFYTKESFFNGLLEVLTRKKNLIRKKFDNRKTNLEKIINKIDTYIIPYPQISDIPFDEINMDEYRKDKRNKLLKQSKEELKDITIYNYKNNIAPFAKVELIEKVINELFNKATTETDPAKQVELLPPQPITEQKTELSKIWLTDPKITVDRFLKLGVDKGIWDEQNNIITAKGSLYGTGKSLLGNLFIVLKGYTISANIDYKIAGECFCKTFNIPIKSETNEPYKAFSSGSTKQIDVLKKAFNIK